MQNTAQSQYRKVDIVTADKGKLIVLLYDGAIDFIQRAKRSIRDKDIAGKCNNLNRAYDIIQELNFSLDMEAGGELAVTLRRLYLFMNRTLVQAKINRDGTKQMDEVIDMLRNLNVAWRAITVQKPQQPQPQPEFQADPPRLSQKLSA